ncbi:hypothetical protein EWE74_04850 [Sphingobacterium corticibacterium]|uniref:Uncharacterized protein n=2 Tax=Sphingobacterium corticibacterium TaxID=2484746 RepID=A0A4Q6XWL6_9SPHI|nr:hypothetical protein EWE74_04850 [Sphingobacterium corticibacterium]
MKNNMKVLVAAVFACVALMISCKKENVPSIDDYPLNYTIEEIPVTSDIPVGAYLYTTASAFEDQNHWPRIHDPYDPQNGKIGPYVEPELGQYKLEATDNGIYNMSKIVEWAKQAKIDFLITPPVKENPNVLYPGNMNGTDSLITNQLGEHPSLLGSVNMGELRYAIAVDIGNFSSGLNNNALLENAAKITVSGVELTREERLYNFMKRISDYFKDETYYRTNGRPVIVLSNPHQLYTADSKKVYDNIRSTIKEHTGDDVYIIAKQQQWSPSARYTYFFLNGMVDAVTMDNMCNVGGGMWERTYMLSQLINENFKFNKDYINQHFGIDFVPSASPSFSQYTNSGATVDYNIPPIYKDEAAFRERCNVAKMNLGRTPMVLIESFNDWVKDSQIEPAWEDYGNGYGTKYLDIVRDEFKVK